MLIAAATAAAVATTTTDLGTKSNEEPQQQQLPVPPVIPMSATAYVMLDMVTAQKRLLDNIGRLEFTKPVAVVQPAAVQVDVVVGCGSGAVAAAQCESGNVEVTTM